MTKQLAVLPQFWDFSWLRYCEQCFSYTVEESIQMEKMIGLKLVESWSYRKLQISLQASCTPTSLQFPASFLYLMLSFLALKTRICIRKNSDVHVQFSCSDLCFTELPNLLLYPCKSLSLVSNGSLAFNMNVCCDFCFILKYCWKLVALI